VLLPSWRLSPRHFLVPSKVTLLFYSCQIFPVEFVDISGKEVLEGFAFTAIPPLHRMLYCCIACMLSFFRLLGLTFDFLQADTGLLLQSAVISTAILYWLPHHSWTKYPLVCFCLLYLPYPSEFLKHIPAGAIIPQTSRRLGGFTLPRIFYQISHYREPLQNKSWCVYPFQP
jgi:hypothetical protein